MTITLVTDERSHQEVALLLSGVSFYSIFCGAYCLEMIFCGCLSSISVPLSIIIVLYANCYINYLSLYQLFQ